jgi:hypothetical protein
MSLRASSRKLRQRLPELQNTSLVTDGVEATILQDRRRISQRLTFAET